jgi:hypothetical protein
VGESGAVATGGGARSGKGSGEIFETENCDVPRSNISKLLNQMKGNSTDNYDFFQSS